MCLLENEDIYKESYAITSGKGLTQRPKIHKKNKEYYPVQYGQTYNTKVL